MWVEQEGGPTGMRHSVTGDAGGTPEFPHSANLLLPPYPVI